MNLAHEEKRETFRTFTADLRRLAEWLHEHKVDPVARESTGVYWIPVWNVLEPSRYRCAPLAGHKTDQIDCAASQGFSRTAGWRGVSIPPRGYGRPEHCNRGCTEAEGDSKNRSRFSSADAENVTCGASPASMCDRNENRAQLLS